jgi:hypothetical protein
MAKLTESVVAAQWSRWRTRLPSRLRRDQAAAQVAEEQRKKLRATAEAIDDHLQDLARSRDNLAWLAGETHTVYSTLHTPTSDLEAERLSR